MNGKFAVFVRFLALALSIGSISGQDACESPTKWLQSIDTCIHERPPNDPCFRACVQRENGWLIKKSYNDYSLKYAKKWWKDGSVADTIYNAQKECTDDGGSYGRYYDECSIAESFWECFAVENEEVKNILTTKVCQDDDNAKLLASSGD